MMKIPRTMSTVEQGEKGDFFVDRLKSTVTDMNVLGILRFTILETWIIHLASFFGLVAWDHQNHADKPHFNFDTTTNRYNRRYRRYIRYIRYRRCIRRHPVSVLRYPVHCSHCTLNSVAEQLELFES